MSPFEATTAIDIMWPVWARDSRIATVVTLYDLIPLIFPDQYLRDPAMRAFYSARVQLIRQVDGVLALSQHTARDAVERPPGFARPRARNQRRYKRAFRCDVPVAGGRVGAYLAPSQSCTPWLSCCTWEVPTSARTWRG